MSCLNKQLTYDLDIEECAADPSPCDHQCLNTEGSLICFCNEGYRLFNASNCEGRSYAQAIAVLLNKNIVRSF